MEEPSGTTPDRVMKRDRQSVASVIVYGGQAALVANVPSTPVDDHWMATLVKLFAPPSSAHDIVMSSAATSGTSNWIHGTLLTLKPHEPIAPMYSAPRLICAKPSKTSFTPVPLSAGFTSSVA